MSVEESIQEKRVKQRRLLARRKDGTILDVEVLAGDGGPYRETEDGTIEALRWDWIVPSDRPLPRWEPVAKREDLNSDLHVTLLIGPSLLG